MDDYNDPDLLTKMEQATRPPSWVSPKWVAIRSNGGNTYINMDLVRCMREVGNECVELHYVGGQQHNFWGKDAEPLRRFFRASAVIPARKRVPLPTEDDNG